MIADDAVHVELNRVRRLAEHGRYPEVLASLRDRGADEITRSPTLALLYGMALGRLGQHVEGLRWVDVAHRRASEQGDGVLQTRALNVRGAIALERGRIDEAEEFFGRGLAQARERRDHGTVGRCSNNLGIIANMRGQYRRAVGSYSAAVVAFQRVSSPQGLAETDNNLRITYRDQGAYGRALSVSERAVLTAGEAHNPSLTAFVLAGRAEILALAGEPEEAFQEINRALAMHRNVGDGVGVAEGLRVLALTEAALGDEAGAELIYRETLSRAWMHQRPLLAAEAGRALALLLANQGRRGEARDAASAARVQFALLGVESEVRQLDDLLVTRLSLSPA